MKYVAMTYAYVLKNSNLIITLMEKYKSNSGNVREYVALCQAQLIHN